VITVRCTVSNWEEDDGEGDEFVVARLTDAEGVVHEFVDDISTFFDEPPEALPAQGVIRATELRTWSAEGRTLTEISTETPDALVAEGSGLDTFVVERSSVAT